MHFKGITMNCFEYLTNCFSFILNFEELSCSHSDVFRKIALLKIFKKSVWEHSWRSLNFIKVAGKENKI